MKVTIIKEAGYEEALLGLSLSYNKDPKNMRSVAMKLSSRDGGHNKFLESIVLWLDITAPRYWWQQFDTYRVGVTKQSESTMHTVLKRKLTQEDFEGPILTDTLEALNQLIADKDFGRLKNELPEGFLQRRIVCLNYKVIRHIIRQRRTHRLPEWQMFCDELAKQAKNAIMFSDLWQYLSPNYPRND